MTFDELPRAHGIDPAPVTLLRHTGERGRLGFTPHDRCNDIVSAAAFLLLGNEMIPR